MIRAWRKPEARIRRSIGLKRNKYQLEECNELMIFDLSVPAGRKNARKSRAYIPNMRENEERKIRMEQ